MKHSLSLVLLLACGSVYASDIDLEQWNELKRVVSKHRDLAWAIRFDEKYPKPSENGVRELAQELDFTKDNRWVETCPEQLSASINGEGIYGLTPGKCTKIICAVRKEMRQNRNNQ